MIFGLVIKPAKAALGFSDSQLGLLAGAAFALSYALFSPFTGLLVDRLNRKRVMICAVMFWSLMTLATGLATSFTSFVIARAGVGVGEAFLTPLAVSMIGDTVAREGRLRHPPR